MIRERSRYARPVRRTPPRLGHSAVEGIGVGRASVWARDPVATQVAGTVRDERARLVRAVARATEGVRELVRLLPRAEAELFEPELAILAELGPLLLGQVEGGALPEDAVNAAMSSASIDLLLDARARILDALAHDERSVDGLLEGCPGDRVLVTEGLTPSVVASLPARVVAIVAASELDHDAAGGTSHATILARCRDIPLAFVAPHLVREIAADVHVIVDTTSSQASVWHSPGEGLLLSAHARRDVWTRARAEEESKVAEPLTHLGLAVLANVGSLHEHVSPAAEGIGLLRTELVFSDHVTAPSEAEQVGAMRVIAGRVGRAPVVVRLFDAGGDKAVPWLAAPDGAADARGIELLLMHSAVLDTQLRAIVRAAERADVRVLLPMVTCADDVTRVRARIDARLRVGALIETPAAVDAIDAIVAVSDFVCIGTNDLSAHVLGLDRAASALSADPRILRLIERVVTAARARGREVCVCGEMASDPHCARILVGLGVGAISVAAGRLSRVKLSLRDVSPDDCRDIAREASALRA